MITDELFLLQDLKYKDFQAKLIPNINPNTIIGIRTSVLRNYAKKLIKLNNYKQFLSELPHKYFDENQLHAFIISEIKNYDECITYINEFLPYINNWATCDQTSPRIFKNHLNELLPQIKIWLKSKETYTIRFAIGMLMQNYLNDNFKVEYLTLVSKIKSNEYYVNMMIAWFFATALAKQYDKTILFIENKTLDIWAHNKTIQKALESYRITEDQKKHLKSLRRKA